MARKNIFGTEPETHDAPDGDAISIAGARPLANFERPLRRSGPVGAFSQSLGGISEKAQRAADLEKQLAHGQAVVELDPALIDNSFVPDRLVIDLEDLNTLVGQIRDHGQQVPILVRPHPDADGRYQVAYGHRRLAAVKRIGGTIKAVIRPLSDEQLVVSQGQENNARTDLSYIERTFFALRLERRGFARDVIMSSLGVDKAALSRMIGLAATLPDELIEAIGPAPGFGRTRWAEMAELVENASKKSKALKLINAEGFREMSSDERFDYIIDNLRAVRPKARTEQWKAGGSRAVKITETTANLTLNFNKAALPTFGTFVEARLDRLYEEFLESNKESKS
ncbi:ParB family chromosome partitioning protein [Shinella sp. BE166]|uniref:plasmid partitioning protein RepB n=1 Tax=Shinella sp. BE166 TaxID=3373918 RepID=UPI003EBBF9C3